MDVIIQQAQRPGSQHRDSTDQCSIEGCVFLGESEIGFADLGSYGFLTTKKTQDPKKYHLPWQRTHKRVLSLRNISAVKRRTGIARSRVQTPLKSWIFFRLLYAIAFNCVHNCEDQPSLDFISAVDMINFIYIACKNNTSHHSIICIYSTIRSIKGRFSWKYATRKEIALRSIKNGGKKTCQLNYKSTTINGIFVLKLFSCTKGSHNSAEKTLFRVVLSIRTSLTVTVVYHFCTHRKSLAKSTFFESFTKKTLKWRISKIRI